MASFASFEGNLVRRVVVIRPNHRLGNGVLLTPLIAELERRFPAAQIDLITAGTAAQSLFKQFPQVSVIHEFSSRSYCNPVSVLRILGKLRRCKYDIAIDPNVHSRSARFMLGQVQAQVRIGYAWGQRRRDRKLTHPVDPARSPVHLAQNPLYLLWSVLPIAADSTAQEVSADSVPSLRLTAAEHLEGRRHLASVLRTEDPVLPCLGIFAHASGTKCLAVDWWNDVIEALRRDEPSLRFVEFIPADGRRRLANVPGIQTPDLRVLGAALAATTLVVMADCGVMHLADAAGARVVCLFKTTDPLRYGPSGSGSSVLTTCDVDTVVKRLKAILYQREMFAGDEHRRAEGRLNTAAQAYVPLTSIEA